MAAFSKTGIGTDDNLRSLIVISNNDYSHLLNRDRQHSYQILQCESVSEALAIYQQESCGCILLDLESSTPIDRDLLTQINIAFVPVVILFEAQNTDNVRLITEDCLAKETLTSELISFAIGQAIAKAALKQKLAETECKLQKYETGRVEKPLHSSDFLLSIHNLLSRQLQKQLRDRQASENLLKIQNTILEKIAKGEKLSTILDMLALKIETQLSSALCSILICDQHNNLNHGAAPNLPEKFANQCNGIPIEEGVGSCGTAAFRKKPVIVPDITTDSLWQNLKDLALDNGLLACWSFPIISSEGLVLGTFGVYHREIYTPTAQELEVVSLAANIAGIALERDRIALNLHLLNQELEKRVEQRTIALQESETRYRLLTELSPVGIFRFDKPLNCIYVNDRWSELTGRSKESALGFGWMEALPPEEREFMIAHWAKGFDSSCQIINQGEVRHLLPDGSFNWVSVQVAQDIDANGKVFGYIGTLTDITDRKLLEVALQKSEAHKKAIINCLPDLLIRMSREGILLEFLATTDLNVMGNLPSTVGHNISDILPPDLAQKRIDAIQLALENDSIQIYEHDISRDGRMQIEEIRIVPYDKDEVIVLVRDISDRKAIETALRASESHLRALINAMPDLILRVNSSGIYQEVITSKGFRIIGDQTIIVGTSMSDMLPSDVAQKQIENIQIAIQTGSIQIFEQEIFFGNSKQTEEVRIVPYSNDEALLVVRDITERKNVEIALQASEENNQAILGAVPDLLLRLGRDGTCLDSVKPAIGAESFLPIDYHISEVLPEELLQKQLQTIDRAISTGELQVYEHQLLKQDRLIYQEVRILAINNNEVLAVVRDISDRKMAELSLVRTQEELNYHIEHSPLATIRWDREFRIAYWSKQAETIFGWKSEEVLGKGMFECQLIYEDDIPQVQMIVEQLMQGLPQNGQNQNRSYHKDGTIIHTEWYNSVLMDENGNLVSMLSLAQDISKRKQIEIEIVQSREDLSQTAATLKQQMERQHLITHITQQIHQSLNIDEILTTAVNEIKRLLNVDRVVIFQFIDGVTKVVKEKYNLEYLPIIDMDFADNYFSLESINYHLNLDHDLAHYSSDIAIKSINYHHNLNRYVTLYGSLDATSNEYSEYIEKFVKQASIKSQIVIPIIQYNDSGKSQEINHTDYINSDQLWGLLMIHSCAQYHHWQQEEVDLLKQIANQLAIAIQQSILHEQVQSELYNRQQFERQLMNELNQKKVLLKEIHHRVKNNLQVMSSILYLQFRNTPSEIKKLTEEYQNRILSMSLIHEQLYRSDDLAHIDFQNYISLLISNLFECYNVGSEIIHTEIKVEDICLSLDQSIPLGLIINEIVSNALKYAFPRNFGKISISLIHVNDQIILTISDDGVGLPEGFDLKNADGLGMQLILSLTEQLDGNLIYDSKKGLTIKISFPILY